MVNFGEFEKYKGVEAFASGLIFSR